MRARHALLLTLTLPLATGCAKTTKERLEGRWLGESVDNAPAAQAAQIGGWVKGTAIEFSGSKATITIPAESPRSGGFTIAREDGQSMILAFTRAEGGKDEAHFRFVGEDQLRWTLPEGPEVVLVRAKN